MTQKLSTSSCIFYAVSLLTACLIGCSSEKITGTTPENQEPSGGEEYEDIQVIDGKVRFFLYEAEDAARKAIGTEATVWQNADIKVNGVSYDAATDERGRAYIDVKASGTNTYNATVTDGGTGIWHGTSLYSDIKLPVSQFYGKAAKSLKSYPMYGSYTKETGNKLVFNDAFAVLDLKISGGGKVSSVKVSDPAGALLAGSADMLPSRGYFTVNEGLCFAVLNCTANGEYVPLAEQPTDFHIMLAPGDYKSGLEVTVTDSDHRAMTVALDPVTLTAGKAYATAIDYSPEEDLVFHESFDNFVWGGDIMGGEGTTGYAPTDEAISPDSGTDRDGYAEALAKVPYNTPGTAFIQSNTWDEVNGKTVGTSHLMSDSYIKSRNIGDYTYMFRCQEYQGVLACGTGNTGRGIFQTSALRHISGLSRVKASFDFCYQPGSTDLMLFQVLNGGSIRSVSINGNPITLDETNSGFSGVTGKYILEKDYVTIPANEAAAKEWQHVEVVIDNATDGTMLYWAGNSSSSGVHGFYLDNISVRSLGQMPKGTSNLRVLYWNIQNGMWSDQDSNYDTFVKWVRKYDPDICVWCEASSIYKDNSASAEDANKRFLPDGWAALAARYGHAYTAIGGKRDNYPQVVTSKYPIETLLKITDTDQAGKPVSHGAGVQQIEVNGQKINILTLHLWPQAYGYGVSAADQETSKQNNEGDKYREFEIKYICSNTLGSTEFSDVRNWLMLGDFNSRSPLDNWHYKYPENDTRLLVHKYILDNTGMKDIIAERYEGSFISTTSGDARIDFVYASEPMYGRIVNAWVLTDGWTTPVKTPFSNFYDPSDHRPIIIDFEMK